jgi:hypothetical protein
MVKIYLKHRFTKANMSLKVTDKALEMFGSMNLFANSKVIHSHATYFRDGKLYQLNINEKSPKCDEDFWALNFFRTYSDCLVASGKTLRNEPRSHDTSSLSELGVFKFICLLISLL